MKPWVIPVLLGSIAAIGAMAAYGVVGDWRWLVAAGVCAAVLVGLVWAFYSGLLGMG